MFDKLKGRFDKAVEDAFAAHGEFVASLDDPLAAKISWKPLEAGGSKLRKRELRRVGRFD